MKLFKRLPFLLLVIILLVPTGAARADAAPPMNPPGGDVSPEGQTQVQMVAEQVVFDFRASSDDSASVNAWFLFKNQGNADEHLKVRFPLNGDPISQDQQGNLAYSMIGDFTASVGGAPLPTQVVKDSDANASQFFLGSGSALMYWSEFDMDFPVGQNVKLTVNYTFHPATDASSAEVDYILATGAGWSGPIGKADLIFRFPYIINDYNFLMSYYTDPTTRIAGTTVTVQENEIRLHWDDLEPTSENNVSVWIKRPSLWAPVLSGRSRVIADPGNEDAWLSLARAYAAAAQEHHGMDDSLTLFYVQAMERALAFDPNNVALHVEIARTMEWPLFMEEGYLHAVALNELATALKLDPANADALDLLHELQGVDTSFTLPTPGPFPAYAPTAQPTGTTLPPATLTSVPTATPISIPSTVTLPPTSLPSTATLSPTAAASTPAASGATGEIGLPWIILIALVTFGGGVGAGFLVKRKK